MKGLFSLLLFINLFPIAEAQELRQTVKGRVVDAELETPLPGANIILLGSDPLRGTVSDANGYFKLEEVPVGRQSFQITLIGYEARTIPNVMVTAGKELDLLVKMTEAVTEIEEITVSAEVEKGETINQMAIVSARSFSVEETKRYAGSFDDPGRMAQSFAGVASSNDSSNEIVIRGNSPRGVLWKMEGIEIPNPNHFSDQGASGGAISMLNSNMMTNSDFFTGAFPSEYGNALSGVFDIHLRKGNFEKREYAFQLGVLGTDVALEGPFKKGYNGSYLVNYRYSTLSIMNKIGINVAGDAVPVFQDLSFNIQLPTKKAGNFSLFGLGGNSAVTQEWEGIGKKYDDQFGVWMGIGGITHTWFLNDHSYLKSILSINATKNLYDLNVSDSAGNFLHDGYRQDFLNTAVRGTITWNNKISAKHLLRAGLIYSALGFNLFSDNYDENTATRITYLDQEGESAYAQGFFTWKYRATDQLTLQTGIHYLHYLLNNNYSVEPRLGMKYQFSPRHSIHFGAGIHSRIEDLTVYMTSVSDGLGGQFSPNKNLDFTRALHLVLGYDISVNENFHIKPEIYFQYLYDVPIVDQPTSYFSALNYTSGFTTDTLSNKGNGQNYGVELTAERYFADDWFFMFTGSLYQSTYTGGDGIERNTRFNGNYATTAVGGKEFRMGKKKNNVLSLSSRINYAGGRRYVPVLLAESIAAGQEVLDGSRAFENRQEDYFRMDFQISFKRNKGKTTRTWKVDAQNIFNRQNIFGRYYDNELQEIRTAYQLGFIPVISYKIEF